MLGVLREPFPGPGLHRGNRPSIGTSVAISDCVDRTYDVVIAGAGLAGLSSLAQLARAGWRDQRILIIDDHRSPLENRSWAYWSDRPGLLDAACTATWSTICVHAGGSSLRLPLQEYRYRLMTGPALLKMVAGHTDGMGRLECTRATVRDIVDGPGAAAVVTDHGTVSAQYVLDSVRPNSVRPIVTMTFCGQHVEFERPVFDSEAVTLFDFRVPQDGGSTFVYLLPTSPRRALVEYTHLVPAGQADTAQAAPAVLTDYLDTIVAAEAAHEIRGIESGRLQLGVPLPARDFHHVVPVGITAGMLKPSTGYGFTRIQRHSAAVAAALTQQRDVRHASPVSRRFQYLDEVFLHAIATEPRLLETAFASMFTANPADRILRFLDERSTAVEIARIISSLPPAPFLKAARHVPRRGDA